MASTCVYIYIYYTFNICKDTCRSASKKKKKSHHIPKPLLFDFGRNKTVFTLNLLFNWAHLQQVLQWWGGRRGPEESRRHHLSWAYQQRKSTHCSQANASHAEKAPTPRTLGAACTAANSTRASTALAHLTQGRWENRPETRRARGTQPGRAVGVKVVKVYREYLGAETWPQRLSNQWTDAQGPQR